jgi:hypothetical protein
MLIYNYSIFNCLIDIILRHRDWQSSCSIKENWSLNFQKWRSVSSHSGKEPEVVPFLYVFGLFLHLPYGSVLSFEADSPKQKTWIDRFS